MPSEVTICNLALGRLGDRATVSSLSPPEGSAQAQHCAMFYPLARNSTLQDHDWSFARTRATLANLLVDPPESWLYGYEKPADCLQPRVLLRPGQTDDNDGEVYLLEGTAIYSNTEDVSLRYTQLVTDPNQFSPLFVDALAWRLASYLAGPVLKGDAGQKAGVAAFNAYLQLIDRAKALDANAGQYEVNHTPGWIGAR